MAWKIHSWSVAERSGSISSPHFGPWPFGDLANPAGVLDFVPGEEVSVEVEGIGENSPIVRAVHRIQARRFPPGTHCSKFGRVNEMVDLEIMEQVPGRVAFHVYDCCDWCQPGYDVVFEDVVVATGLEFEDVDEPWFRFASDEEKAAHAAVPIGYMAYTVVLEPSTDNTQDIFIVAKRLKVSARPRE